MKVTGVKRDDGSKDYEVITDDNRRFMCVRHGQKFQCCGVIGTMKQLKQMIADGTLVWGANPDEEGTEPEPTFDGHPLCKPAWECVDPCALLILFLVGAGEVSQSGEWALEEPTRHSAYDTLDKLGWLLADKNVDVAKALREHATHKRLTQ